MSYRGIKKFASLMSQMQSMTGELIEMGCKNPASKSGQQDIRLGRLCDQMKDAVKWKFCKITMEKT